MSNTYTVKITENTPDPNLGEIERFSATVDELDLEQVIQAVYRKPRAPRKPRSDAGKTRGDK